MKTLKLNNQLEMPMLGLGTWLSKPGEVYKIVKSAIQSGYRHIDCAYIYENEKEVGQALEEIFSDMVVSRQELFITSKLWNDSHAQADVIPALKQTLSDLKLDYLDLYLIHWPVVFKKGVTYSENPNDYIPLGELPIIETYGEMEKAVGEGLVKSIGVSNFGVKKLKDLVQKAEIKPAVNQVELHPYLQQKELVQFCKENQVKLTAYSPLGSSGRPKMMLAGDETWVLEDPLVAEIAKKHGKSPAQVILNWGMSRGIVVIPKTVNPERAVENFKSQDFELEAGDMAKLAELDKNYRYVNGEFFAPKGGSYTVENIWE